MNKPVNQVHPQVYISNINFAREGDKSGIDVVITVCQDSVADNVGEPYHYYCMSDGPNNEYGGDSSYEMFSEAAQQLLQYLREGKVVLCHCHRGASRSAAVAIAALAVFEDVGYHEMYSRIKNERPQISPDSLLVKHAVKYIEYKTGVSEKERLKTK